MSTAAELIALAERVEGLTRLDAEVDALIRAAAFAPSGATVKQSPINGAWCVYTGEDRLGRPRLWEPRGLSQEQRAGSFTSSLDAAMLLVPEGCAPGVYMRDREEWAAMVFSPSWQVIGDTRAPTAPLALTAAALRARAAILKGGAA